MEKESKANKPKKSKEDYKLIDTSKTMSFLLRHGAKENNLVIDSRGFVELTDLLNCQAMKKLKVNKDFITKVIDDNNKKRFELISENGKELIRAVQGHTIKEVNSEDALDLIENIYDFPTIVHGTFFDAWEFIKNTGLNRMSRNCIHFAIGGKHDSKVISGMRGTCEVYVEVDGPLIVANGIKMYLSKNKVVLSEGVNGVIEPSYFKNVFDKNGNCLMACKYQQVIVPIFDLNEQNKLKEIYCFDINSGEILLEKSNKDSDIDLNNFSDEYLLKNLSKKPTIMVLPSSNYVSAFNKYIQQYNKIKHPALFNDFILLEDSLNLDKQTNSQGLVKALVELNNLDKSVFTGAAIKKLEIA